VVFRVNGRRLAVRRRAPYVARLDTRRLRNGRHLLRATAYDGAGNHRSRVVRFVVRNDKHRSQRPAQPQQERQTASAPAVGSSGGVGTFAPVPITGTTYYVSSTGSDTNDGTSPQRAWRTVRQANRAVLQPGDGILFEAGVEFSDDTLMPGRGGAPGKPIVYGSFGQGRAVLPKGVWFRGKSDFAFQNLSAPGAQAGIQGHGDRVTVQGTVLERNGMGIYAEGDDWTIEANHVDGSGDSGMILLGQRHTVRANLITDTGIDPAIAYGKHGIYLKVADATVVQNTIRGFHANGISVRFRDSLVERNTISQGPIGIGWFQNDPAAGTSTWRNNDISQTTAAGIYVSRSDSAGPTRESFVIVDNRIDPARGAYMDLTATQGTFSVSGNLEV
ncbi:MAG: right-handed parallel beta-helix repeat-containing protein, partial [Actinomycetota bacterium]|nr:right-handed parallel beta-helix repeat-containing protein [Actinomycetota bacterium]